MLLLHENLLVRQSLMRDRWRYIYASDQCRVKYKHNATDEISPGN